MKYKELSVDISRAGCTGDPENQPVLQAYLLDESKELKNSRERTAVLVCPGGAYRFRSDREGEPIAMRFLARGMQAFVLHYSVAPAKFPCALVELAASVACIREHAKEWHIDEKKIFLCGFSAGGHLCASLGTMHRQDFLRKILCDTLRLREGSWRPDGMILAYPVISSGSCTHEESRENLIGRHPADSLVSQVSLEKQVTEETVPTFLWHTWEDDAVPVENSLLFAAALRRAGVSCEMHIYEKGGHGLALCDEVTEDLPSQIRPDVSSWLDLAVRWLRRR